MKATGRPDWFRVTDTATSDESHYITYGLVLSGQCGAAYKSSYFKLWNALHASASSGNCFALIKMFLEAVQREQLTLNISKSTHSATKFSILGYEIGDAH